MGLTAKVGNFSLALSGNSVANYASKAKALFLLATKQVAAGFAADAQLDTGFSNGDGVSDGCSSIQEVDNQAVDCNGLMAGFGFAGQLHCLEQVKTGSNTWDQFAQATLDDSSFTMVAGAPSPPVQSLIDFLAIGGSDVQVAAGNFNLALGTGNQQVKGVGFTPDLVLFFWGAWKDGVQGANTAGSFGYGAADGTNQWAMGTAGQGPTNSTHKTSQRTDRCINYGDLTSIDADADFVSRDIDGFTINVDSVSVRALSIGWVALKGLNGVKFKVGSFNKSTAAQPVTDAVNLGFSPAAMFLASHGTAASASLQADSTLSFGFADGTNHGHVWVGMKDASATTGAHSRHTTDKAISVAAASAAGVTPTLLAEADVSFLGSLANVRWTTNNAVAVEVLYWAVGTTTDPNWVSGDRAKETTTTTGTGDITLAGAVAQHRAFSALCVDGDQVSYAIVGQTGTEWECGIGTWHVGNTLTRTRVTASSNAGALVNFSAGTKDVFVDIIAMHALGVPTSRIQLGDRYVPPDTSLIVSGTYEIAAGKTLEVAAGATLEVT